MHFKLIHVAIVASLVGVAILFTSSLREGGFLRGQVSSSVACADSADNDSDGNADHPADLGCLRSDETNEFQDAECFDGIDNDSDGAIDSQDFSCIILFNGESLPIARCADGMDNDGDGSTDLGDSGCASRQDHSES